MLLWSLGCMCLFELVFLVFWYIPRSGIAGSYSGSIFSFLRNLHAVFHSGHSILRSYISCTRVSFSLCLRQHFLFVFVFREAILAGMMGYITVVVICISLMINDVEHLLMLAICISSLEKCLFSLSSHFLIGLIFLMLSCIGCL